MGGNVLLKGLRLRRIIIILCGIIHIPTLNLKFNDRRNQGKGRRNQGKGKLPCPLYEGSRGREDEAPYIRKPGILSTH